MKNTRVLRRTRRAGLTLIELIVVLAILVALGGIAVAVAPDLIKRAHVAEHVTNANSVETAVQTNRLTAGSVGSGFDSLIDGTAVFAGVPGSTAMSTYVLAGTNGEDAIALNTIGIQQVWNSNVGGFTLGGSNATFEYTDYTDASTNRVAVATGARLASIPAASAAALFNLDITDTTVANSQYLVFGIGPACSLVGANGALSEAPVHFGESEASRANNAYARYLVVVQLAEPTTANAAARLLGVAVAHDDGLARASGALAEWYE